MSCGCSPCNTPLITCTPPPVVVNFGSTPGAVQYRLDITQFVGGTPVSLDSVPILPFLINGTMVIQIGGATNPLVTVQKIASTAAPVTGAIIRPPDYNAATNPYQWYVIG